MKLFLSVIMMMLLMPITVVKSQDSLSAPAFITEDFQINENVGSCSQDQVAMSALPTGGYVLVWQDYRNFNADIYGQKFNRDGSRNGGNFKIDRAGPGISCFNPQVCGDPNGGFTVVWEESGEVMCRRFDRYGSPRTEAFELKIDFQSDGEKLPVITGDRNGGFIVAWQDKRNDQGDIYCQRYDSTSTPIRDNFVVNDDNVGQGVQSYPSIASDQDGGFIIVWQDNRLQKHCIYGQCFDTNGRKLGFNFCVDKNELRPEQWFPDVSIDDSGNFVIVWEEGTLGNMDIAGRRYDPATQPLDDIFFVTTDSADAQQFRPRVGYDAAGNFTITWHDNRRGDFDIFAQVYDADGLSVDEQQCVNDSTLSALQQFPVIASDGASQFMIAWNDWRYGLGDIFSHKIRINDKNDIENIRINDDDGSSFQENPAVTHNRNGTFMVTWSDYRYGGQDIYLHTIDSASPANSTNLKVSESHGTLNSQVRPAIAASRNTTIVWHHRQEVDWQVRSQQLDDSGGLVDSNKVVSGFFQNSKMVNPHISCYENGNSVMVWAESDNQNLSGNWNIYAQRFDQNQNQIGTPILVNFDTQEGRQDLPQVAVNPRGGFVITYYDYNNNNNTIMCQRFDSQGIPLGTNFIVNTGSFGAQKGAAPLVCNYKGEFFIVWSGRTQNYQGIFYKRYDGNGVPVNGATLVDSVTTTDIELIHPAIDMDFDNSFIIAWQKSDITQRFGDIYANYYDETGQLHYPTFKVHTYQGAFSSSPDVAIYDGRLFAAWQDNRITGQGVDIWGSLMELHPATRLKSKGLPFTFSLKSFPNPFNPRTTINYTMPQTVNGDILIVNLLGQQVSLLKSGRLERGEHHVAWDGTNDEGRDVPSGMYICVFKSDSYFKQLKLMLIR